jgi:alkanesulfonate monooxygenase SsuD/methylene tetrahydromethanopterin reductase-like flavin-dependent oxidoreductase (luciferase family)
MEFGIFDHVERAQADTTGQYEDRLNLIKVYEEVGFHAFFKSEHHTSKLSIAPSPAVFLAAASQRTSRIKLGSLVFTLAIHDPLRLAEEVAMLDQLTKGRLQLGVGRGANIVEQRHFGRDPAETPAIYNEAIQILLQGLRERRVDFQGKYFNYNNVPIEVDLVQKPLPPLWFGVVEPRHIDWAVANDSNVVMYGDVARAAPHIELFRVKWLEAGKSASTTPFAGILRNVVIADTDEEAMAIARRAYRVYENNHMHIWVANDTVDPYRQAGVAKDFDAMQAAGLGFAGSPSTVRDALLDQVSRTGADYLISVPAFGDISLAESTQTARHFAAEVMPALREHHAQRGHAA